MWVNISDKVGTNTILQITLVEKAKEKTKRENKENEKAMRDSRRCYELYCEMPQLRVAAAAAGLKWIQRLLCWNNNGEHTRSLSILCSCILALRCQNHSEFSLNTFKKTPNQIYPWLLKIGDWPCLLSVQLDQEARWSPVCPRRQTTGSSTLKWFVITGYSSYCMLHRHHSCSGDSHTNAGRRQWLAH